MSNPWDQWIKRDFEEDYPIPLPLTPVTAMLAQFTPKKPAAPKPALPADYRPREISSYSPALKRTGGYSYSPSQSYDPPPKEHIYNPAVECPEDYRPPSSSSSMPSASSSTASSSSAYEPPKQPQGNNEWIRQLDGTYKNMRTGKCIDAKGRSIPCR